MKNFKSMVYAFLLTGLVSCGASATGDASTKSVESDSVSSQPIPENTGDIDLINLVYEKFVFAIDSEGDEINHPEKYFTAGALKKLQDDYEFDCDEGGCYAYYALRTGAQDSNPESDGASKVYSVEPADGGWYIVYYSDMGWPAKTRIRIVEGKIDDYELLGE